MLPHVFATQSPSSRAPAAAAASSGGGGGSYNPMQHMQQPQQQAAPSTGPSSTGLCPSCFTRESYHLWLPCGHKGHCAGELELPCCFQRLVSFLRRHPPDQLAPACSACLPAPSWHSCLPQNACQISCPQKRSWPTAPAAWSAAGPQIATNGVLPGCGFLWDVGPYRFSVCIDFNWSLLAA
jgi:hypothetical protein